MLAPPLGAREVQGTIVYPVNAEVKNGAMFSLGVNSRILNEGFRVGLWAQSSRTDAGQRLQTCC